MNTKSILMSVLMIGVVAMAAGAGTLAHFSDTETATGNTFTAGIIDIAVDGDNPWTTSQEVTVGGLGVDKYLKPSQIGLLNFTVQNVGDNPLDLWKMIHGITYDTGKLQYDCNGSGTFDCSSEPEAVDGGGPGVSFNDDNQIGKYIWFDLYVAIYDASGNEVSNTTIISDYEYTVDEPAGAVDPEPLGYIKGKYIYLDNIPAGYSMYVEQSFHLYSSTPNLYQGDVMTFTETLQAMQCEGAMPEPSPEHPDFARP